jgi:aryl sulfotransferase
MRADFDIANGRSIVWLASYPKSGSTWVRAFLTAYHNRCGSVDLNALIGKPRLIDRQMLDDLAGIESAELSPPDLMPYQAMQIRALASSLRESFYCKTHSKYLLGADGEPMFPAEATAGAIYIVRNPMDIVPSYAHHDGKSIDTIIEMLGDDSATLDYWPRRSSPNLPQVIGSWSSHVASWIEDVPFPVHVVRYEDLLSEPHIHFPQITDFIGLPTLAEGVAEAVDKASFPLLAEAERRNGFAEKPSTARPFFREGKSGVGHTDLNAEQRGKILLNCGRMMQKVGYSTNCIDYHRSASP